MRQKLGHFQQSAPEGAHFSTIVDCQSGFHTCNNNSDNILGVASIFKGKTQNVQWKNRDHDFTKEMSEQLSLNVSIIQVFKENNFTELAANYH